VIAGAAFYMIRTGGTEGVLEYVYVDKFVDKIADYSGRTFKVHGTVVPGTVRQKHRRGRRLHLRGREGGPAPAGALHNMVPDTFAEGGEVVLTGELKAGRVRVGGDGREVPLEVRGAGVGRPEQEAGQALNDRRSSDVTRTV
jgi:cytochrome c-type biogenesis protein CcmE